MSAIKSLARVTVVPASTIKGLLELSDKQLRNLRDLFSHFDLAPELLVGNAERKWVFKKLRKWLKCGSWRKVVDELLSLAGDADLPEDSALWTESANLDRHGEEGHLE